MYVLAEFGGVFDTDYQMFKISKKQSSYKNCSFKFTQKKSFKVFFV